MLGSPAVLPAGDYAVAVLPNTLPVSGVTSLFSSLSACCTCAGLRIVTDTEVLPEIVLDCAVDRVGSSLCVELEVEGDVLLVEP